MGFWFAYGGCLDDATSGLDDDGLELLERDEVLLDMDSTFPVGLACFVLP